MSTPSIAKPIATAPGATRPGVARRQQGLVVMCVGMFLVQLDVTVVNVALPAIRSGLHAGLTGQQWVVDAYAVTLAALLLAGGTVGDRCGHKRVVLAGLGLFGLGSLGCGLAPSIGVLIAVRAMQGAGAALLLPGTLAVITHAFPERSEQARAVGIWAGVSALALPAGPLIGGALVSALGWGAVFFVNLPIITIATPLAIRVVTEASTRQPRRMDLTGTVLAAIGLAAAVYAVIAAGGGHTGIFLWVAVAAAVLAGPSFAVWERRAPEPLLPPGLVSHGAFTGANLVAGAMNFVGIGTVFIATLYLQTVQHHSALVAGVMLLPLFVPLAALAPLTGRLTGGHGPRPPMTVGLVLGAAGSAALIGLNPNSTYLRFLPVMVGLGVGMGLLTAAVVAAAVRAVPADRAGLASGVNNTARQAAGAMAIAVYGAIAGSPTHPAAFTSGLHRIGAGAGTLWLAALALTWGTIPGQGTSGADSVP